MIGAGTIIQIENKSEHILFRLDETYEVNATFDHLESITEDLLREVFSVIDSRPAKMPGYEYDTYPCVEEIYRGVMNEDK